MFSGNNAIKLNNMKNWKLYSVYEINQPTPDSQKIKEEIKE